MYWNRPDEPQICSRCESEIDLLETCIVGPGDEENEPPFNEPTMRVTLSCQPSCYQFSFPLGPLIDPNGVKIEKREIPDGWLPDSFIEAIQ